MPQYASEGCGAGAGLGERSGQRSPEAAAAMPEGGTVRTRTSQRTGGRSTSALLCCSYESRMQLSADRTNRPPRDGAPSDGERRPSEALHRSPGPRNSPLAQRPRFRLAPVPRIKSIDTWNGTNTQTSVAYRGCRVRWPRMYISCR